MKSLVILLVPWCLIGCITVELAEKDRVRMDRFIFEWKRFNDSLDRVLLEEERERKRSRE